MAFPVGWGRRCTLVIQSSKVDANQSDFPVLLTKDTLPSEMFDHDGSYPALEGGGDIRFSSDEGGNTQLACEVVSFSLDDANNEAEIWVKVPSVSSSTDTTFYCWYSKAAETQPAADSTYGSENVWDSNFVMVQHMNQDPSGSAPQMIDSTGNDNDGTSQGSMTSEDLVDGKIGKALDFDGSNNSIRRAGLSLSTRGSFTLEAIVKLSQSGVKQRLVTLEDATAPDNGPQFFIRIDTSNFAQVFSRGHENDTFAIVTDDVDLNDATYHFIAGTINGDIGKAELFVAGVSQGSVTQSQFTSDTMPDIVLGSFLGDLNEQFLKGVIDEVRISNIIRSAEWIKASRNNQFSPGTFVIEGTPATPGGAAPTSIFYGPLVGPFGGPI